MTRYSLEMAKKHREILYDRLSYCEEWIERHMAELFQLKAEKERLEKRIIKINEYIAEEERLDDNNH